MAGTCVALSAMAQKLSGCCAGAGRKIIRCEVSLDGAKSWQLAEIHRACAPNAYGKHWAWVHWELRVPICKPPLLSAIACRYGVCLAACC